MCYTLSSQNSGNKSFKTFSIVCGEKKLNAIRTQRHDCVWSYQGYMTKQALEQRKLLHLTTKNCSFHSFFGFAFYPFLIFLFFAPASTILTLMNYCFENEFKKFHLQQHFLFHFVVELLSDGDIMWIEHDVVLVRIIFIESTLLDT